MLPGGGRNNQLNLTIPHCPTLLCHFVQAGWHRSSWIHLYSLQPTDSECQGPWSSFYRMFCSQVGAETISSISQFLTVPLSYVVSSRLGGTEAAGSTYIPFNPLIQSARGPGRRFIGCFAPRWGQKQSAQSHNSSLSHSPTLFHPGWVAQKQLDPPIFPSTH